MTTSRKPGSAPDLGKVSRMPGFGRRGQRRRRRHDESHWQQRQRQRRLHLVGWSIGIGVVSLAILGVAFAFWLLPRLHEGEYQTSEADRALADSRVRVVSKFKSPSEGEALALVKRALALRNADEVEELIRPGSASTQEVVGFLAAMKAVDGEIDNFLWLSSIDKNGLSLEGVQVTFAGKNPPRTRLAILTPDHQGVWKLDFAAFARWGRPSWDALLEGKAESGVIRVYAAKDSYFNGPFRDERKWSAYKLASPDSLETMVGYCKVGSAQQRAMELLWRRGEAEVARVTLEIRRTEGTAPAGRGERTEGEARAERGQFEITRVLAEDWVMGDKPLDDAG